MRLRCDNEFAQQAITAYYTTHGITIEASVPHAHHQAGTAERSHRTVRERAAAMIQDFSPTSPTIQGIVNRNEETLRNATLPEGLWIFAMMESVNKKNRAPAKALRFLKTPYEALHDRRPNLAKDNAWGARVYVTTPPEHLTSRLVTKLHHPRGYLAHFLCAISDEICLVWRSDTHEVKRVTIARVDNSTGFNDVQPHGLHINDRAPIVLPPIPDEAEDSDSSSHSELYNDVAFVSFTSTTDVFSNEIDWSLSPPLPRTYDLVDENNACGPCLQSNTQCRQPSDTDNDPYKACLLKNRDCNYQTQSNRDAITRRRKTHATRAKKRKERQEAARARPTISPFFNNAKSLSLPANNDKVTSPSTLEPVNCDDDIQIPSTPPHTSPYNKNIIPATYYVNDSDNDTIVPSTLPDTNSVHHSQTSDLSISDTLSNTSYIPCVHCLNGPYRCYPSDTSPKCTSCIKNRARCIPATEEQQQRAANCCTACNKNKPTECVRTTPDGPCTRCVAKNNHLNCKPKRAKLPQTLPLEERCITCQRIARPNQRSNGLPAKLCDGQYPCNVCVQKKKVYISIANKDDQPCNRCTGMGARCNLASPCQHCEGRHPYSRYSDNDTTWTSARPNNDLDQYPLNHCIACFAAGKDCSGAQGDHPCYQCLVFTKAPYDYAVCTMKVSNTTYSSKEKAAYSVTESDDLKQYNIVYNPEYIGKRTYGRPARHQSTPNEFDEGLHDNNLYRLDNDIAMSAFSQPQHASDITVDNREEGDLASLGAWYENLSLDNDLPELHAMAATSVSREPRTYKEAMTTPQATGWHNATQAELKSLLDKDVYKIVPLPSGTKAISSKFVYKAKLTPTRDIAKLKARVVARGFQQRPGIDYDEKFSPTAKSTSIRTLLALCTLLKWTTSQVDVYVAFLNAELKEQVYCIPPPPVKLPRGHAWLLQKSLYGLVQSPRTWYQMLTSTLTKMGFRTSPYDPCVYTHTQDTIIISVHVNDIRIYAPHADVIDRFKAKLSKEFVITSEDPDALYLSMHIKHSQGTIKIHQAEYVRRTLEKYDLQNLPTANNPCDHRTKLTRNTETKATPEFKKRYLQMFGSLNYMPVITRVDLAYAASLYGRFSANPSQAHLDSITRAYSYTKGTRDTGITYSPDNAPCLAGYVDADWAGCTDSRRSTTGYVFTLANGPISWSSAIQKVVAQSTCEAEYMALGEAVKEAIWLMSFINDLNLGIHFSTVPIHVDNQSAIKLSKNPEFHQRSKHIDIRHHFIRDHVQDSTISVQ
ncbi:unnamed protein product [Alternaria burnsii]|nr:unnamed protein product [Alternaria burnsii]